MVRSLSDVGGGSVFLLEPTLMSRKVILLIGPKKVMSF